MAGEGEPTASVQASAQHSGAASKDVHEVDLSDEWLSVLQEVEPGHPGAENAGAKAVAHADQANAHQTVSHKAGGDQAAVPVESSASPSEFEITPGPVATEHDAKASLLEPVQPASPLIPPPDMPGYAEFQVAAQETPAETPVEKLRRQEEIRPPNPVRGSTAPAERKFRNSLLWNRAMRL